MTLKKALNIILEQDSSKGNMAYAQEYAKACLVLGGSTDAILVDNEMGIEIKHKPTGEQMVGEELRVQILYVLSNLESWRGEQAREVKKFLKSIK